MFSKENIDKVTKYWENIDKHHDELYNQLDNVEWFVKKLKDRIAVLDDCVEAFSLFAYKLEEDNNKEYSYEDYKEKIKNGEGINYYLHDYYDELKELVEEMSGFFNTADDTSKAFNTLIKVVNEETDANVKLGEPKGLEPKY